MKTRMLIFIIIFLLSISFIFAEADKKKISEKDFWNALSGTWVNTEYLGTYPWYEQKLIVHPDGKWECYPLTTDTNPSRQGYYLTITEAWIDSEGILWGKSILKAGVTRYQLHKISGFGNTWEICEGSDAYPIEMDNSFTRYNYYSIRYRQ